MDVDFDEDLYYPPQPHVHGEERFRLHPVPQQKFFGFKNNRKHQDCPPIALATPEKVHELYLEF